MARKVNIIRNYISRMLRLDRAIDDIRVGQGMILRELQAQKASVNINDHEFQVFSQWGEDGIIQYLTRNLAIPNKTFIEFGIEDFSESNCRFLMVADYWRGFVIDGSPTHIESLRQSYYFFKYQLQAVASFITRENVVSLLERSGFDREVGILSVDVDGVDYHLLAELRDWRAAIVIVEYNSSFGSQRAVSIPYSADFVRARVHPCNAYWGASLPAFDHLLSQRGYALVGVNRAGSNAFFVRRDLLNERVVARPLAEVFRENCFREARDASGQLTMKSGRDAIREAAGLPLIDVIDGSTLTVADVID